MEVMETVKQISRNFKGQDLKLKTTPANYDDSQLRHISVTGHSEKIQVLDEVLEVECLVSDITKYKHAGPVNKIYRRMISKVGTFEFVFCPQCDLELEEIKVEQRLKKSKNDPLKNILPARYLEKTLWNFIAKSDGQTRVLKQAQEFLQDLKGNTGLVMLGKPGTGKTHLACGIIRDAFEKGVSGLYATVLDFVREIKDSWNRKTPESDVIKKYFNPELLVLDEIGVQFCSETEAVFITDLVNKRYNERRPTILISNADIQELETVLGARLIDRFREGSMENRLLTFDWESQRPKEA